MKTQLTIGITAHSEGIILHKTLLSVDRAVRLLQEEAITYEVIITTDNANDATLDYLEHNKAAFAFTPEIISTTYGDSGRARNEIVSRATGAYITFIDSDDLMTATWLRDAYSTLKKHEKANELNKYIAHTESTIEFGDGINNIIVRYGETTTTNDTLLSVFANRWNVVLMVDRRFLLDNPYPAKNQGHGFEDWYVNCLSIYHNMHNVLVPKTAIFVRRKLTDSVWAQEKTKRSVLRANPLLSFKNIRKLTLPGDKEWQLASPAPTFKGRIKTVAKQVPFAHKAAIKAYHILKKAGRKLQPTPPSGHFPEWLRNEWLSLHKIDKSIYPPDALPAVYHSITEDHYKCGIAYKLAVDTLKHDTYDYILFTPWLIKGGADLFAIYYANTIAQLAPRKRVLVVSTTEQDSPWATELSPEVDFLPLGKITARLHEEARQRVYEQIIENSGATHLHILNSLVAYDFVESHAHYLQKSNKRIIVTSFSESTDGSGRTFGYSHTHVPRVYELASAITSDNQRVLDMWQREYGFNSEKLALHRRPVTLPTLSEPAQRAKPLKILWAARLSPEKIPNIVPHIAQHISDLPIEIHMYGGVDDGFDDTFIQKLPTNVTYHGAFDGFDSLQPEQYDLFLYTSLFDGMPNVILEASSYGLPIVTSRVGGIPEVLASGESAEIIDSLQDPRAYADAIRRLVAQPEKLLQYGEAARTMVQREFSLKAYEKSLRALLKKTEYLQNE